MCNKKFSFLVTFTDSQTKIKNELNSGRKETPRPRSRSLYTTNSYVSDDSGGLYGKYEGSGWLPRQLSNKNLYLEEYNLNVKIKQFFFTIL